MSQNEKQLVNENQHSSGKICAQCEANARWNEAGGYTQLAAECRAYCLRGHTLNEKVNENHPSQLHQSSLKLSDVDAAQTQSKAWDAIAAALRQGREMERERCAKIADDIAAKRAEHSSLYLHSAPGRSTRLHNESQGAASVAAAIRAATPDPASPEARTSHQVTGAGVVQHQTESVFTDTTPKEK